MKIKRIVSLIIFSLLLGCFIQSKPVEAAKGDLAGEKKSDYAYAINDLYEKSLLGGVTLYKQQVKTLYNGNVSNNVWNSHTVQWVDIPSSSESLNVVTWTNSNAHKWKADTVRRLAQDYEKNNPGWIVIAAVNGDFFDNSAGGTGEPTNLHVQNGEVYQPYSISQPSSRASLGFINNDFRQVIYGEATLDSNLSIEIIKNNIVIDTKVATRVNDVLSETGINVLTKDMVETLDLTGYKVLVGEYDVARMSFKNNKKIFVKGTIVSEETLGKTTVPEGNFYLASKDGSLDNFVEIGDYVRCQHKLTGEWTNVKSALGYIYQIVNNGKTLHQGGGSDLFITTNHPRTFIGYKKDGSVVMMVVNGRGTENDCEVGASLFQGGELMRLAGCQNAFNLDGGGSSTLIVRNERGVLEVINKPSDKSERSDGNAVLVVMKDPKISFAGSEITRTSISFAREISDLTKDFKNITIEINNKTYDFINETIEITGLEENTEYEVIFSYEINSIIDETKYVKAKFKTKIKTKNLIYPSSGLEIVEVGKNTITVNKEKTGYENWIQDVIVYLSGTPYYMGNEETIVIDELLDDTKYVVYFSYNVVEPGNPKLYPMKEEEFEIHTLAFDLPKVIKLEVAEKTASTAKIEYQFDDEDDISERIYMVAYNEIGKEVARQEITRKRGNVEFSGLDLTAQSYSFKIEFQYYENEEVTLLSTYYSQEVSAEKVIVETPKKKTCKKSTSEYLIATLSVASLAILIFRKKK